MARKAMRILVIRHAWTDWNEEKRLQGRTDLPLSEKGRVQARSWRLPDPCTNWQPIVSPLKRAQETARILFPKRAFITHPRLIEMNFGLWEGKRLADLRREPGVQKREDAGLDFRPPQGESPREVQLRLLPLLEELTEDAIFVAHKSVIRALYSLASGWDMKGKQPDKFLPNCARLFEWKGRSLGLLEANIPLLPSEGAA